MNVGSIRVLLRALTSVLFLFAVGCSQAVPTVSVLTTQLTGPKVEGATNLVYSYAGGQVLLRGTCSTYASQVQISTDESTWATFTNGTSDSDCAGDGQFSFDMSTADLASIGISAVGDTAKFFVRTVMMIPTSTASVEIKWEADLGPAITIVRSSSNNSPTLSARINFPVPNAGNEYKYKITSDVNQCRFSSGYTNSVDEATEIFNVSLSKFADGPITLCAVGTNGTNWNPYGAARSETWIKDTKGPAVILSTPTTTVHESFEVRADISEIAVGFDAADFVVTGPAGAVVGGFTQVTTLDGTVTISPVLEGSYTIRIPTGRLSDADGNTNTGSNALVVNFTLPTVQFSSASANVPEGNSGASSQSINVTKTFAQSVESKVNYEIVATSTATNGVDFNLAAGTLTFAAGSTAATISYDVIGDLVYEGSETLTIRLAAPVENAKLGTLNSQVITILDEESVPTVQFVAATSADTEGKAIHDIVVSLSGALAVQARVNYAATAQTAGALDFTLANGTLTFAPGTTSLTIPIAINNDNIYEGDETFSLVLSNPVAANLGAIVNQVHTITDDEGMPSVAFLGSAQSFNEATSTGTLTISLSHPSAVAVSVNYDVIPGTATGGGVDYTLASGTLSFPAFSTTGNLTVTIVNDTISEADETFAIDLVGGSGVVLGSPVSNALTIVDNDGLPSVSFSAATGTSNENDGTANIGLQLTNPSSSEIVVAYGVTGGTATSGSIDFGLATSSYTFAAGQTTGSFMVTINDDAISELTETFNVTLSSATNANLGTPVTHTHSIVDNELLPVLQFSTTNGSATEANGIISVPVAMSRQSSRTITVDYSVTAGTATSGSDYAPLIGTLTIAPGQTIANIALDILDDILFEGPETVIITLANVSSAATAGSQLTHAHTINDNESTPTLQFSAAANSSGEGVMAAIVVNLSGASGSVVNFDYAVTAMAPGAGVAMSGTDYTLSNGSLSFAIGQTTLTISVPILNDVIGEPDEIFAVQLSDVTGGGVTLGTPSLYAHTILANDTPTFQFASSSSTVQENVAGGTHMITVELSNAADSSAVFSFSDFAHTATYGTDYTVLTSSPVTIPSGSLSATIVMTILDDAVNEPTEHVQFNLTSMSAVATVGSTNIHQANINDDDAVPAVSFTSASSQLGESTVSHTITVSLDHASTYATSVVYSASGTASGSDYSGGSGTLNFSPNQTTAEIILNVVNDMIYEGNETVTLSLSAPAGLTLGSTSTHTHTILDAQTMPTVQFAVSSSNAPEGTSPHLMVVNLSTASTFATTVNYANGAGSATAGSDYTAISGTLNFPAGTTTATIALPIIDDSIFDPNETVSVGLSNPVNSALGIRDTNTVTIVDDETQPMVSFALSASSTGEGVASHTVQTQLSAPASTTVTVNFAVTGGTATAAGVDYTLANGTLTFAIGQTTANLVLPVVNDTIFEGDETVLLNLSSPIGATLGSATHAHTILDDDTQPSIQFSAPSSTANENVAIRLATITLSNASANPVTANLDYAGTATSGSDYSVGVSSITFAAGETSKSMSVSVINDVVYEGTETIAVSLGSVSGAIPGTPIAHQITISDDETQPTIQFNAAASVENESTASRLFVVSMSGLSQANQNVTYSVTGGTATSGTDFAVLGTGLTFVYPATTATIVANITDDSIFEGDETFILTLTSASTSLGSTVSHTSTINDNETQPTVAFQMASDSTNEYSGNATIVAVLSGATQIPVTFSIAVTGGTATTGVDFSGYLSTYTISAGSLTRAIPVVITSDSIYESDETFALTMSGVSGATLIAPSTHTHTIIDDDPLPTVAFVTSSGTAATEGGNYTAVVALSNPSSQSITVQYTTNDGTATLANSDYTATNGTLTFAAGSTMQSINIPIISDSNPEPSETFFVNLSATVGATLGSPDVHTGIIPLADVSAFTWVGSSIIGGNANWNNPSNWYGGTIPGPSDTAFFNSSLCFLQYCDPVLNVDATVGGVTVDAGYTNTITMQAGRTLSIGAAGFTMAAGTFTGGAAGSLNTTTFTLNGGTFTAPQTGLTASGAFNMGGGTFLQNGSVVSITGATNLAAGTYTNNGITYLTSLTKTAATLNGSGNIVASGNWNIGSGGTTAISGITVNFNGSTSTTLAMAHPFGNVIVNKQGTATLSSSTSLSILGNLTINNPGGSAFTSTGVITVAGDLSLTQCSLSSGTLNFTFNSTSTQTVTGSALCAATSMNIQKSSGTLSFAGNVQLKAGFTYTSGSVDFTTSASTLSFIGSAASPVSASSLTFYNLSLKKSSISAVTTWTGTSTVSGNLVSSSTSGPLNGSGVLNVLGNISWAAQQGGAALIAAKGISNATLTCDAGCLLPNFTLDKAGAIFTFPAITNIQRDFIYTSGFVTANNYKLNFAGTATSTLTLGSLVVENLQVSKTGSVGVSFNPTSGYVRNLEVTGSSTTNLASGTVYVLGNAVGTGTDGGSAIMIFDGPDDANWKGTGWPASSYTISKTPPASVNLDSDISINSTQVVRVATGTLNQKGFMFTHTGSGGGNSVTGASSRWIAECGAVTPTPAVTGGGQFISGRDVTVNIQSAVSVSEGAAAVFAVSTTPANCQSTAFIYGTANGTAISSSDYTGVMTGFGNIPTTGSTSITIATTNDGVYEGDEYFTVSLSGLGSGALAGNIVGTVTLSDTSTMPTLSLSSVASINESAGNYVAQFTLTGPTQNAVTFDSRTTDMTAIGGSDYSILANTNTTIPAGQTVATRTITINNDNLYEGSQTFSLDVSSVVGALITVSSRTVTIIDDETMPLVSFSNVTASGFENETGRSLPLVISPASEAGVVVTFATPTGTAIVNNDFTLNAGSLSFTIAGGATSANIPIDLFSGSNSEPDESFTVKLDASGAGWAKGTQDETTFTIYDRNIGNFSVTGIGNAMSQDTNYDGLLNGSPEAEVVWSRADNASSYTLDILESGTPVCSQAGIPYETASIKTFLASYINAVGRTGCNLKLNGSYVARVTAIRTPANTTVDKSMPFTVGTNTFRDNVYPSSWWGRMIQNDGPDVYNASNAVCANASLEYYGKCIHAGEKKKFVLKNIRITEPALTCVDLKIRDGLDAFNWDCLVSGNDIVVRMMGLKEGLGASDLVDFTTGSFKPNSIFIEKAGPAILFTSAATVWWENPFTEVTGAARAHMANIAPGVNPDPVYFVKSNLSTNGLYIQSSSVIFLVRPGAMVIGATGTNEDNCNSVTLEETTGIDECVLVIAKFSGSTPVGISQIWVEGKFDGDHSMHTVIANKVSYSRFNKIVVDHANVTGLGLSGVSSSRIDNLKVAYGQEAVRFKDGSSYNLMKNFMITRTSLNALSIGNGVASTNNIISSGVIHETAYNNISVGTSNNANVFTNLLLVTPAAAYSNFRSDGVLANTVFNNVVAINNTSAFNFFFTSNPSALTLSQVIGYNFSSNNFLRSPLSTFSPTIRGTVRARGAPLPNCTMLSSNNCPFLTSVITTASMENDFVGNVADVTAGTTFMSPNYVVPTVTSYTDFDRFLRSYMGTPNPFGASTQCYGSNCYPFDWSLSTSADFLKDRTGNGSNGSENAWTDGAACPAAVNGDRTITSSTGGTYLINALEILDDGVGNEDGLCQANEKCLYTPNFGAFQGTTSNTQAYRTCTYNANSGLTGITIYRHASDVF